MKFLARAVLGVSLMLASLAVLAGEMPFNQKTFDDLRAAGSPVVVDVHAPWCPVCKKQDGIVNALLEEKQFKDLTVLIVDFDTEKDVMKSFNINYRSTFVVFKGPNEVGRSTGDTQQDSIAALFLKAL